MEEKTTEELIGELRTEVQKLKTNKEKVPLDVLKTKYKKPYEELLNRIKDISSEIYRRKMFDGITIQNGDSDVLVAQIQNAVDERMKEVSHSLYREYDVDKFLEIAEQMHTTVNNLWIPYWQSHCGLYVLPENWEEGGGTPRVYNDLTNEFCVDMEKNVWEKHPEWENENRCFITAGACHILAGALKDKKEEQPNGQTGKH